MHASHSQRFTHIWTLPLGSMRVFKKFPSLHPSLTYIIAVTFYVYILNPMWLFVCSHYSLRFTFLDIPSGIHSLENVYFRFIL